MLSRKNMQRQKTAVLGLLAAAAVILGYVESLIPVFAGVPGIKLGLANLAVLFVLQRFSWREADMISAVRILVIGFLFGNMFSILYSLAGASLSLAVMAILLHHSSCSLPLVSVAGGISHNIGQLVIAMLLVHNASLVFYAPALLISGVLTGLVIGFLTVEVRRRIPL